MNHFHRSIKYYVASLSPRRCAAVREQCQSLHPRGVNVVFIDEGRDKVHAAHSLFETRRQFVTYHRLVHYYFDEAPAEGLAAIERIYETYDPATEILWLFVRADAGAALAVVTGAKQ